MIKWNVARMGQRFRDDRSGSVILIFALALVPIMLLAGVVIDYGRATQAKAVLDGAADSAALGAVSRGLRKKPISAVKAIAESLFDTNATAYAGAVAGRQITVVDDGDTRVATATYTASVPLVFGGFFGSPSVEVKGKAVATQSKVVYIDFFLLLDNSPSMGIGATSADMIRMINAPGLNGCEFACHVTGDPNSTLFLARRAGITLRIDVLRTAAQELTDTARTTQIIPGQYRMAVNTLGRECRLKDIPSLSPLSTDMSRLRSLLGSVELMESVWDVNQHTCTDLYFALAKIDSVTGPVGSGEDAQHPQKIIFMVTDGINDYTNGSSCSIQPVSAQPTRCIEPMKYGSCDAIKRRGVKIALLYTTYQVLENKVPKIYIPDTRRRLEDCASPGLFFEVSPNEGISQAMSALFRRATKQTQGLIE